MVVVPKGLPGVDTRGLPEGYDPHQFYEYKHDTLVQNATGIESLIYKYIPWRLLKSWTIALDPTAPFKVAPTRITPENRTRKRSVNSVLNQRKFHQKTFNYSWRAQTSYNGIFNCNSPGNTEYFQYLDQSDTPTNQQEPLVDVSIDTTSRTRLVNSEQGTMRFFKSYINSPSLMVRSLSDATVTYSYPENNPPCVARGGTRNESYTAYALREQGFSPTAATFSQSNLDNLRVQEYSYLDNLIFKNAVSMFKDWSPNRRTSTLYRNIVELRDIPRSIASLQSTLIDLRKLHSSLRSERLREIVFDLKRTSKHIPDEYLSFHFGWKQTYKDLMDLLALPEAMSKKYSFLIKRAGKPTTFRLKRNFTSRLSVGLPTFSYSNTSLEYDVLHETTLDRETELRLVINATFDFPPLNAVSFRSKDFYDRIGLIPRPTDLYNLLPWTWLVDWFTGLGSYVELIDNMARDDTLVNWGMITGKTTGKLTTRRTSKVASTHTSSINDVSTGSSTSVENLSHSSILHYECQIRKDAAAALSVKTTSGPNLTPYQESILGALLAQRKGKFIPKT